MFLQGCEVRGCHGQLIAITLVYLEMSSKHIQGSGAHFPESASVSGMRSGEPWECGSSLDFMHRPIGCILSWVTQQHAHQLCPWGAGCPRLVFFVAVQYSTA